jgi:hypothetical protein
MAQTNFGGRPGSDREKQAQTMANGVALLVPSSSTYAAFPFSWPLRVCRWLWSLRSCCFLRRIASADTNSLCSGESCFTVKPSSAPPFGHPPSPLVVRGASVHRGSICWQGSFKKRAGGLSLIDRDTAHTTTIGSSLAGLSATPSKIIVAFNLIASPSRFRLWAGSWG